MPSWRRGSARCWTATAPAAMMVAGAVLSAIGFLLLGHVQSFLEFAFRARHHDGRGPCAGLLLRGERHGGPVVRPDAGAGDSTVPSGTRHRQGDHFAGRGLAADIHRLAPGLDAVRRSGGGARRHPGGDFHAAEPGRHGASPRRRRPGRAAGGRGTDPGPRREHGAGTGTGSALDPEGGPSHIHLLAHRTGFRHGGHRRHRPQPARGLLRPRTWDSPWSRPLSS